MAITGMFFDAEKVNDEYDRLYSSGDFSKYLNQIVGNGVFPVPSTQLQVRASSGLTVLVAAGEGWIDGHKLINSADMELTLDAADALLARIDRIIFYCDYTERQMGIEILKGTAAVTPAAPALTRTDSRWEMCLAEISIPKQTTTITQALITDTRADSNVCGWVAGLIEQIDTSTLFLQWQTAYSDYYAMIKQQLDDFMATLTTDLRVNTYVRQFVKTESVTPGSPAYIAIDPTGYTYESTDIINVFLNGLKAVEDTDYTFSVSSNVPYIAVAFDGSASDPANDVVIVVTKSIIGIANT